MLLITSQPLDFDITKDKLDLNKSTNLSDYFDSDKIFKKAYEWLFKKLNNDKFIWCYKNDERNFSDHGNEHVLWTLDVPDNQCFAINSSVWNCVINNWPYIDDDIIKNIDINNVTPVMALTLLNDIIEKATVISNKTNSIIIINPLFFCFKL